MIVTEEQGAGHAQDFLGLGPFCCAGFQVLENSLLFRKTCINVLGVDPDLATVAPTDFPFDRFQGIDNRAQEGRFSLPVVPHDRRS